jgi:hypothetical protein
MTTLLISGVIGTALAAVLNLFVQEHRMLSRTASWNAALPIAEAGIEEAMSHLQNVNGGDLAVNGWGLNGSDVVLSRALSEGRFEVAISSALPHVITSTGYIWSPSAQQVLKRRIQARSQGRGIFMNALVAKEKITLNGQVIIDSFDSADPLHSLNGAYSAALRKDNGNVATNLSTEDAMDLGGQVLIYGTVATGPVGVIKISDPARQIIGKIAYITSGGQGIESERYAKDMNVSFPDVTLPFSGGAMAPLENVTVGGIFYRYAMGTGQFRMPTLSISGSEKVMVAGDATLLVDQDVSISESAFIQINAGATFQLYVQKGSVSISGQGVANLGHAANFSLWGMPHLSNVSFSGDNQFIGTIYAPQAKLNLSGDGATGLEFTGAAIVNEVNASGQCKLHYDEALGKTGGRNITIASWKEI